MRQIQHHAQSIHLLNNLSSELGESAKSCSCWIWVNLVVISPLNTQKVLKNWKYIIGYFTMACCSCALASCNEHQAHKRL
jgi:hypothetical protein